MPLPEGTYVRHLNGDGLDCRCQNLRLVRGTPSPADLPPVEVVALDGDGRLVFLRDVVMEAMICSGHPNSLLDGDPQHTAAPPSPSEAADGSDAGAG